MQAHPGDVLSQAQTALVGSLGYKANIVMINCGTNDADENLDISSAGARMESILNTIWNTEGQENPDACVMLSLLLPTKDPVGSGTSPSINSQYMALQAKYEGLGKCIYIADTRVTDPSTGDTWFTLDDLFDTIHPTDFGYLKLADIFVDAIMQAYNDGKIITPLPSDTVAAAGCDKTYGNGVYAGALTQRGSGVDDGIYLHNSEGGDIVFSIYSAWSRNQYFTAKLYSPDRDDIVGWFNSSATATGPDDNGFVLWKNDGNTDTAHFTQLVNTMAPDLWCLPEGIQFQDMNGE